LSKGADPNIRAHDGFDPLMSAVEKGEKEICALLLDRGANVKTKTRLATPLMIAKEKGHGEVEKLLVSQNFKFVIIECSGRYVLTCLGSGASGEFLKNESLRKGKLSTGSVGCSNMSKNFVDRKF